MHINRHLFAPLVLLALLFIPSPTHASNYRLKFIEPFVSTKHGWILRDNENALLRIDNGRYVFENRKKGNKDWQTWIQFRLSKEMDFTITAWIEKTSGRDDFVYGIKWAGTGVDDYRMFGVTGNGRFVVNNIVGGQDQGRIMDISEHINKGNSKNVLRIDKTGGMIAYSVNNHEVARTEAGQIDGDQLGFVLYSEIAVAIDHLEVEINPSGRQGSGTSRVDTFEVNTPALHSIYLDLVKLAKRTKGGLKSIQKLLEFFETRYNDHRIYLRVNNDLPSGLFGSARYTYYNEIENLGFIEVRQSLVNMYQREPAPVLSVLMHEIQHAYNHANHTALFNLGETNRLERAMFELDALGAQHVFIRDYLVPAGYRLTPYEKAFLSGGFDSIAASFMKIDARITDELYLLRESEGSAESKLERLAAIGRSLNEAFSNNTDTSQWQKYLVLLPIETYSQFAWQAAYNIVAFHDRSITPEMFRYSDYPEVEEAINNAGAIIAANPHDLGYPDREVIPAYEEYYKSLTSNTL